MIDYKYTAVNRLNKPETYMYSEYQGVEFLESYFESRLVNLKNLKNIKKKNYENKIYSFLNSKASIILKIFLDKEFPDEPLKPKVDYTEVIKIDNSYIKDEIKVLSFFKINEEINSENLMVSLVNNQINRTNESAVKFWLDLLVQRFEVAKKIYNNYTADFRKGNGKNDIVQIYWLFALSLTLFFCETKEIKYINTLLKVSDLLFSLDEKSLNQGIQSNNFSLILLVELLSIKLLSKNIEKVGNEFA